MEPRRLLANAPFVAISGASSADEVSPYTLNLSFVREGINEPLYWTIDWGDGQVETVNGNPDSVQHVFANGPAQLTISASATDAGGTYPTNIIGAVPDDTFGVSGVVAGDMGIHPERVHVYADDGFVYLAGGRLYRFDAHGQPVTTFGSDGVANALRAGAGGYQALALAVQSDGKILVGGSYADFAVGDRYWLLSRFNENGSLDSTFGNHGIVKVPAHIEASVIHDLRVQPDGKILAAGELAAAPDSVAERFAVARFNADGTPDAGFGPDGIVHVPFDLLDRAERVDLLPDGKVLVAGTIGFASTGFGLARLNPDGTLDETFGDQGTVRTTPTNTWHDLDGFVQAPDGDLLLAGRIGGKVGVLSFRADSTPETGFGNAGSVILEPGPYLHSVSDLVLDGQGNLLLAGSAELLPDRILSDSFAFIVRVLPDGTVDSSFGDDGVFRYEPVVGINRFTALAFQRGGKLLAGAGFAAVGAPLGHAAVMRLDVGMPPVTVMNVAPAAVFSGTGADERSEWSFTFSSILDGAADLPGLLFSFDFDGDGIYEVSDSPSPTASHVFSDQGQYTLRGRIKDPDGAVSDFSTTVQVANAAPTATINISPASEGADFTIRFVDPQDSDADSAAGFHYDFDLNNDGIFETSGATSLELTARFLDSGTRVIRLRIRDKDGGVTEYTPTVQIADVPPLLSLSGKRSTFVGLAYTLGLSSTDVGNDTIASWTIDWGDGSPLEDVAGNPEAIQHTFAKAGRFTVHAVATDEDGTHPASRSRTVEVLDGGLVTGRVFNDLDADAKSDSTEAARPRQTVFLDRNNDSELNPGERSTRTDAKGNFRFDHVPPGTYRVIDVAPAKWRSTTARANVPTLNVTRDETLLNRSLGQTQAVQIGGTVFLDANGNRRFDAGEIGLFKVRVFLDLDNDGVFDPSEPDVLTDRQGHYVLTTPTTGKRALRALLPSGYRRSGGNSARSLNISPAEVFTDVNFSARRIAAK